MTHYIGDRFGRLVVLGFHHKSKWKVHVLCRCDCGTEKIFSTSDLKSGRVHSCGCLSREIQAERTKNKIKHTHLHYIYLSMKKRCFSPKTASYKDYGGRGISMCKEWADRRTGYRTFEKWALENGYSRGLSIDRINNDGNYCPENCRWATNKEQANNKRDNHIITVKGARYTLSQAQDAFGISAGRIRQRIHAGWSEEDAALTPIGMYHKYNKPRLI